MAKKYQGFLDTTETKIIKDQSLLKFEAIKNEIQILPELKSLIPPLNEDEFSQLEKNIRKEGCREAVLIWETRRGIIEVESQFPDEPFYVLIDGHNRYEICSKWNIDFKIHVVRYETLDQVKDFMIDNQLGRRNITAEQASYLRGLKYNSEKKNRGQYERENQSGHFVHFDEKGSKKTAQKLAEQYNVNEKTIRRDAEFAKGIELLPANLKTELLSGKSKLSKTEIIELGKNTDTSEIEKKIKQLSKVENRGNVGEQKKNLKSEDKIDSMLKSFIQTPEDCDDLILKIKNLKKALLKNDKG